MADKADALLISAVLKAGVRFGVVQPSVRSSIVNVVTTAIGLWLPLTPLLFVLKRIMDGRNGGAKKRRAVSKTIKTSFADVAGEPKLHVYCHEASPRVCW